MIGKLFSFLIKLIYENEAYVFYTFSREKNSISAAFEPELRIYQNWETGGKAFHSILPRWWMQPLYYRFRKGQAQLITWEENGQILAYGWIQTWSPFRKKFGSIFKNALMLGPYFTEPKSRGKGLYKKLLAYSLAQCEPEMPIAIYTSPSNISSQRGIEGSGFEKIGTFRIQMLFRHWVISEQNESSKVLVAGL
jgi:GNAT superfamily N-acetyltransferase